MELDAAELGSCELLLLNVTPDEIGSVELVAALLFRLGSGIPGSLCSSSGIVGSICR
jgi:hypothetical protein